MDELEQILDEKIGGADQGEQVQSVPEKEVAETKETQETEQTPQQEGQQEEVFEIGGQKYTLSQLEEALKKARDYEYLQKEFTRKSQKLSELEKQFQQSSSPEDQVKAETLKYLRENLGLMTREDFNEFMKNLAAWIDESNRLNQVVDELSKKYDGTRFPKFDYSRIVDHLYQKYGEKENWPPTIDLEYEYFDLNREFFSKLPEVQKKAVPSERGIPSSTVSAKKIETLEDLKQAALEDLREM
jgi:hypothetical protein